MPIFKLEGDSVSDAKLVIAQETNLELESHLEDWIENSPVSLVQNEFILWIDRQTSARDDEGTIFPDLLGVDADGNLVVVELKRDKAPRQVIAQLLEYAAWANDLSDDQIQQIANSYLQSHNEIPEKNFQHVFKEVFDIPETDEIPPLNRNLRMFIVAKEIPSRIASVCRFLRTSHGLDISCIDVSAFETESGEKLVSFDTKVGDEDVSVHKILRKKLPQFSQWSKETERQIVWDTVLELTDGNVDVEFDSKDVRNSILSKHPNFNPNTVKGILVSDTVNNPAYQGSGEDKYWRVKQGTYRINDPENDKIEDIVEVNASESRTENPA